MKKLLVLLLCSMNIFGSSIGPVGAGSVEELERRAEQLRKDIASKEVKKNELAHSIKQGSYIPGLTGRRERQLNEALAELSRSNIELEDLEQEIDRIKKEKGLVILPSFEKGETGKESVAPPSYETATVGGTIPVTPPAEEEEFLPLPPEEELLPLPSYEEATEPQDELQEEKRQAQELARRKKQREVGKQAAKQAAEIARQREEQRQKELSTSAQEQVVTKETLAEKPTEKPAEGIVGKQIPSPEKTFVLDITSGTTAETVTGQTVELSATEKAQLENVERVRKRIEREKRLIEQLNQELENTRSAAQLVITSSEFETELERMNRELDESSQRSLRAAREQNLQKEIKLEQDRLKVLEETWKSFTPEMKKRAEEEVIAQANRSAKAKKESDESLKKAKEAAKSSSSQEVAAAQEIKKALVQNKNEIEALELSIRRDEQREQEMLEMQKKQQEGKATEQTGEQVTEQGLLGRVKRAARGWLEEAAVGPVSSPEEKAQRLAQLSQLQEKQRELKEQWSGTAQGKVENLETKSIQRIVGEKLEKLEEKDKGKIFEQEIEAKLAEKMRQEAEQKKAAAEKEAAEKRAAEAKEAERKAAEKAAERVSKEERRAIEEKSKREERESVRREAEQKASRAKEERKVAEQEAERERSLRKIAEQALDKESRKIKKVTAQSDVVKRKKSLVDRIDGVVKSLYSTYPNHAKYITQMMQQSMGQRVEQPDKVTILKVIHFMNANEFDTVERIFDGWTGSGEIIVATYNTLVQDPFYKQWIARMIERFGNATLYEYLFEKQDQEERKDAIKNEFLTENASQAEEQYWKSMNELEDGIRADRAKVDELKACMNELEFKEHDLGEDIQLIGNKLERDKKKWFGRFKSQHRDALQKDLSIKEQGLKDTENQLQDCQSQLQEAKKRLREKLQKRPKSSMFSDLIKKETSVETTTGDTTTTTGGTSALKAPGIAARFKAMQSRKPAKKTGETETTPSSIKGAE